MTLQFLYFGVWVASYFVLIGACWFIDDVYEKFRRRKH